MSTIGIPMTIPELDLKPEPAGGIQLSDDIKQALVLLAGYFKNQRVLIKCSRSGSLHTASSQIKDILHITASSGNYAYQGDSIECSELLIMGHPDNTGKVWVKPYQPAATNNSWPLDAKDVMVMAVDNLSQLNLLIANNGETAIILYTR